jgi:four helix bundle protein
MAKSEQFEDIEAWKEARQSVRAICSASGSGLFAKDFGLRDQMRRAAVSFVSNIAEGFERGGDAKFAQFPALAKGSCGELRAQLYVAFDQGYLTEADFNRPKDQTLRISKRVSAFMTYLRRSSLRGSKFKSPQ